MCVIYVGNFQSHAFMNLYCRGHHTRMHTLTSALDQIYKYTASKNYLSERDQATVHTIRPPVAHAQNHVTAG